MLCIHVCIFIYIERDRELASEDVVVGFKWTFGISYIFILPSSYIYIYMYPPLFSRTGRHHSLLPLVTLGMGRTSDACPLKPDRNN